MAWDDDKFKSPLPAWTGGKDRSLGNRMLEAVGGPDTIRTKIISTPDGQVMLRTRGGSPEIVVTPAKRDLPAVPCNLVEADYNTRLWYDEEWVHSTDGIFNLPLRRLKQIKFTATAGGAVYTFRYHKAGEPPQAGNPAARIYAESSFATRTYHPAELVTDTTGPITYTVAGGVVTEVNSSSSFHNVSLFVQPPTFQIGRIKAITMTGATYTYGKPGDTAGVGAQGTPSAAMIEADYASRTRFATGTKGLKSLVMKDPAAKDVSYTTATPGGWLNSVVRTAAGIEPLCEVQAFGNPWHGKFDSNNNLTLADGTVKTDWAGSGTTYGHTHYVKLDGLPAVTTPAGLTAIKGEWWTDAILRGAEKQVLPSTYAGGIGADSWIWRGSDGETWLLRFVLTTYPTMISTGGTYTVTAKVQRARFRLGAASWEDASTPFSVSIGIVATASGTGYDISDTYSDFQVNQKPNGSAAFCNIYYKREVITNMMFKHLKACIRADVTEAAGLPTVALSKQFDKNDYSITYVSANPLVFDGLYFDGGGTFVNIVGGTVYSGWVYTESGAVIYGFNTDGTVYQFGYEMHVEVVSETGIATGKHYVSGWSDTNTATVKCVSSITLNGVTIESTEHSFVDVRAYTYNPAVYPTSPNIGFPSNTTITDSNIRYKDLVPFYYMVPQPFTNNVVGFLGQSANFSTTSSDVGGFCTPDGATGAAKYLTISSLVRTGWNPKTGEFMASNCRGWI